MHYTNLKLQYYVRERASVCVREREIKKEREKDGVYVCEREKERE